MVADKKGGKSKTIQASKASAKAATGGSGKNKKKKWSKGKVAEKANNAVVFTAESYQKMIKEVPKMKLITPAIISERLKVNMSLARRSIQDLKEKGLIKAVCHHKLQYAYTRAGAAADEKEVKEK